MTQPPVSRWSRLARLDWWRVLQWPLLLASASVAAWVSYTQQRQLGIDVGWDSPWGLPIILDGLAAATLLSYIRKPATFNRVVSTLVISAAVVGNAQAAIYDPDTATLPAPLWAVIAWKVLPPVAVFTIAHYIASERKEALDAVPATVDESSGGDTDDPAPNRGAIAIGGVEERAGRGTASKKARASQRVSANGAAQARTAGVHRSDAELVQEVLDHQGWSELSGDKLAGVLRVAKGRALDVRKVAREKQAAVPNGYATLVD